MFIRSFVRSFIRRLAASSSRLTCATDDDEAAAASSSPSGRSFAKGDRHWSSAGTRQREFAVDATT